ncbi:MAG: RNA polymerase sigma factor [Dactylosporangium sp.]|nr:RNA polymerase sigma factor [Dactylosporangium sp.]NNJ60917.1 RNA polymerase sigma factor [Dactylosporangium sp.]
MPSETDLDEVTTNQCAVPEEHPGTREDPGGAEAGGPDLAAAVVAAQAGDEVSFGLLFRAAQPGLLRYLRVLVGSDAEDVASETWLQIARDLSSFRGDWNGFRGWAATIGRHRAIDHLRRVKRRSEIAVPVERFAEIPAAGDTEGDAVDAMGTDLAVALIARLPREQAEAIMLRVVVGLDAASSGKVLGRRAGAVRTAAHRGLRKLDQWFGQDIDKLFGRDPRAE